MGAEKSKGVEIFCFDDNQSVKIGLVKCKEDEFLEKSIHFGLLTKIKDFALNDYL